MFSFFKKKPVATADTVSPAAEQDVAPLPSQTETTVDTTDAVAFGDLALPSIVNETLVVAEPSQASKPAPSPEPPLNHTPAAENQATSETPLASTPSLSAQVWRVGSAQRHPDSLPTAAVPPVSPIAQPAPISPPPVTTPEAAISLPVATVATTASPISTATPGQNAPQTEHLPVAKPVSDGEKKRSWLARLKAGLAKTSANLSLLFVGAKIDDDLYEELEAALLMSDAGIEATQFLLDGLKRRVKEDKLTEALQVKAALKTLLVDLLTPLQKPFELGRHQPLTMMIAGVNGAGKTTTIGKLAKHMQAHHQSVLLAAGDTFRAAAREQLAIWGQRNNVTVISQESGDPAAVAFDAVSAGRARKMDVVMVDTAGRLPTQLHLMEELKKIKRVLGKAMDGAPHEVVLVIDGNTGQNALAQVKAFDDALQLTGLVITKLDGTAKGGVIAAIARVRPIPVYFIGVGEKIEDLQAFNATEFADALLG